MTWPYMTVNNLLAELFELSEAGMGDVPVVVCHGNGGLYDGVENAWVQHTGELYIEGGTILDLDSLLQDVCIIAVD